MSLGDEFRTSSLAPAAVLEEDQAVAGLGMA
jgi:hypothetical protein